MDDRWLSVGEAARVLGVSPAHVRRLAGSGRLAAQRHAGVWFIDPDAVLARVQSRPRAGRPLSPVSAWALLALLERMGRPRSPDGPPVSTEALVADIGLTRVQRHRLAALLCEAPDADRLTHLLRRRADQRRMRVHPGVLARVLADRRVRVGGAHAAAAAGAGLSAGGRPLAYVPAAQVDRLVADYRMVPDPAGNIVLAVVPDVATAREGAVGAGHGPMPLAVAWADLLDDPDARARGAARDWVASLPRVSPPGRRLQQVGGRAG